MKDAKRQAKTLKNQQRKAVRASKSKGATEAGPDARVAQLESLVKQQADQMQAMTAALQSMQSQSLGAWGSSWWAPSSWDDTTEPAWKQGKWSDDQWWKNDHWGALGDDEGNVVGGARNDGAR